MSALPSAVVDGEKVSSVRAPLEFSEHELRNYATTTASLIQSIASRRRWSRAQRRVFLESVLQTAILISNDIDADNDQYNLMARSCASSQRAETPVQRETETPETVASR